MAKSRSSYVCQNCGAITQRWQGKCEACGEWNTIIEEAAALGVGAAAVRRGQAGRPFPLEDLSGNSEPLARIVTGIGELDRVAGGGFVPGSASLIGGEPGIGKSTLLIQACASLARRGGRVVYVSGEESTEQVRLRASRLGLAGAPVQLAAQTLIEDIVATLGSGDAPKFVIVNSIQTMWSDAIEVGARHRQPGARREPGADPLRQDERRRADPRRPRHQGRADRRPARRRAHGRRGDVVRGRGPARVPAAARLEKPLRRDRRDRRLRDDRRRSRRGRQSLAALSRRPRSGRAGRGGVRRRRGRAARAGRDPGARRPLDARARRAARWSAGSRAALRWCSRCSRRMAG